MDKIDYMKEALEESKKASLEGEVPVGAIVVCDGKIIGRGHNTREKRNLVIGHAEMEAIIQANETIGSWKLDGCQLYVTTEPCPMCAGTIMQARIKEVYFGTEDSKCGAFGSVYDLSMIQGFTNYPIVRRGLLKEECQNILLDFFKKIRIEKKGSK